MVEKTSYAPPVQVTIPVKKYSGIIAWIDGVLRRAIDIIASFFTLLFLLPIFLVIALAIKRDSPGPVFFHGKRAGRHGKPFHILKFRTMYERPESYQGTKVTANGDTRITPVGKWLRETKINELPQIWNVLIGEMSLVGPRPEDFDLATQWPEELRREILSVRPGLTSPATIVYRDEESLFQSQNIIEEYIANILPTKMRLDLLYVRNRTVLTDLDVIFWTAIVMIPAARKISIPQSMLYWGPLSLFTSRYLTWFLADLVISLVAIAISGLIWRSAGPLDLGLDTAFGIGMIIAIVLSMFNFLLGLRHIEWSRARAEEALLLILSTSITTTMLIAANTWVLPRPILPNGLFLVTGILAFVGFVAARYRSRTITGLATFWIRLRGGVKTVGERVIIVGAGENGFLCSWLFSRRDLSNTLLHVVGYVDDSPRKQGLKFNGLRVLGTSQDIPRLVEKFDIGVIVYSIENISLIEQKRILDICQTTPARLILLPDTLQMLREQIGRAVGDVSKKTPADESSAWSKKLEDWLVLIENKDWDRLKQDIEEQQEKL